MVLTPAASVCCVLEQNTLSALLQSTQLWNEYQVKGVQCYELFGGVTLKNHAFLWFDLYRESAATSVISVRSQFGHLY